MLLDTDVVCKQSDNHPTDDTTVAGGDKSSTVISNSTVGEWFTRLKAPLSGDLYTSSIKEYQKVFVDNTSTTDDLLDAFVYLRNGIQTPTLAGAVNFVCSNTGDDAGRKIWCYGDNVLGGVLDKEAVRLNGGTSLSGGKNWTRLFRCKLVDYYTGAIVAALGDILIYLNGQLVGMIPQGLSFATSELKLWLPASVWESGSPEDGTSSNRLTPPAGSTFVLATNTTTMIPIRNDSSDNDLLHEQAQPVWGEVELQPGMEPFNGVQYRLRATGSGT